MTTGGDRIKPTGPQMRSLNIALKDVGLTARNGAPSRTMQFYTLMHALSPRAGGFVQGYRENDTTRDPFFRSTGQGTRQGPDILSYKSKGITGSK
jgi:hypothetical protein